MNKLKNGNLVTLMIKIKLFSLLVITTLLISNTQMALAEDMMANDKAMREHQPTADQVIFDALIFRPLSLLDAATGIGLFIVTLPLTAASGKIEQAGETFVTNPMETTFKNCIGCLPGHPRNRNAE